MGRVLLSLGNLFGGDDALRDRDAAGGQADARQSLGGTGDNGPAVAGGGAGIESLKEPEDAGKGMDVVGSAISWSSIILTSGPGSRSGRSLAMVSMARQP